MRLEISKRTDMALKALAHLQTNDGASGLELAKAVGTTASYLPQVVKPMVTAGFIQSTPGPGGDTAWG